MYVLYIALLLDKAVHVNDGASHKGEKIKEVYACHDRIV